MLISRINCAQKSEGNIPEIQSHKYNSKEYMWINVHFVQQTHSMTFNSLKKPYLRNRVVSISTISDWKLDKKYMVSALNFAWIVWHKHKCNLFQINWFPISICVIVIWCLEFESRFLKLSLSLSIPFLPHFLSKF